MNTLGTLATIAAAGCLPLAAATAQSDAPKSGPEPGMALTKVQVYAPIGPYKGKEFDAATTLGQRPGALLFVKDLTRETAPLIRTIDQLGSRYSIRGFRGFTVLLAGDRSAGEETCKRTSKALTMRNPMVVSLDGAEGPGNYAIHRSCTVTLVLTKGGKVVKSIPFTDTGRKDIPMIEKAVESIAGKLPQTPEEWQKELPNDPAKLKEIIAGLMLDLDQSRRQIERMRQNNQRNRNRRMRGNQQRGNQRGMRGGERRGAGNAGRKREGKPPEDPELLGLMRKLIQKSNTTAQLDTIFADIEKHIGKDAKLQKQMDDAIKLLLSLEYGNEEARKRMRAYQKKQASRAKIK